MLLIIMDKRDLPKIDLGYLILHYNKKKHKHLFLPKRLKILKLVGKEIHPIDIDIISYWQQ